MPEPVPDELAGTSVVVTRARAQASGLVQRLAALGAVVVELPVIAIEDPVDGGAALDAAAGRLVAGAYEWVVVTSANAVTRLVDALGGRVVPPATRWAAVGTSTARSLEA
jgi:uroporphyrinogen-III synthase